MKIKVRIDETLADDEVVLLTKRLTDEIEKAARELSNGPLEKISGSLERETFMIDIDTIECFFTSGQKVFFASEGRELEVKYKIYELEKILPVKSFVKINQGVIANIDKMKSVKALINGTMEVTFASWNKQYVSRRNVSFLRKTLEV